MKINSIDLRDDRERKLQSFYTRDRNTLRNICDHRLPTATIVITDVKFLWNSWHPVYVI